MEEEKRLGDRNDARRIRSVDGMHAYMTHLMPHRTDAEVYINETLDVTELLKFLEARNTPEAPFKTTIFHCVVMAAAKIVKMRPLLNRYVSGNHYYMRDRISLGFTIKRQFADGAGESLMMLYPEDSFTLRDFSRMIVGEVSEARADEAHGADGALETLKHLPRPLMNVVMGAIRLMDRWGWWPESLKRLDPNYSSVMLSNLGSIQCNAIYHHLNNIGTNGIVLTIGVAHKGPAVDENGNLCVRDLMNIGVTVDERIADGFYFARSLKLIKHLFAHPELFDLPLEEEIDIVY